MKITLFVLLALSASFSSAADLSCAQQMGEPAATLLAKQCRQVSGATHPPCNASNSCAMMIEHVEHSCDKLGSDGSKVKICNDVERGGVFQGYLFDGGGTDAENIRVVTDKGDRIFAYCGGQQCQPLFGKRDEHDVVEVRKNLMGKRIEIEVKIERNAGRIAGPGDDDRIPLLKRFKLL